MQDESLTPLQNAVYLLKQAQAKLAAREREQSQPIAVVGLGCRFPGEANDPDSFWRLLRDGVDAIEEVPSERWDVDALYDPDPAAPGKMNTRWGGFLPRVDEFDADFFGISPREAIRVDPQQRILLEVAWEALEDAGLPPAEASRVRAATFVGAIGNDYAHLLLRDVEDMDIFSGTGVSHSILANRLSYFLNLTGPSVTLDTACSSSLVSIHLACQSLRRQESDLALAGGVNLILAPETTMVLSKAHMMAPDGRCKAFDASANGYVRGEGCGLVVLKRLADAMADGNRIHAVIRGSAVNHDGRSNGLSAPSGPAQVAVIRAALADSMLDPAAIDYVEAHGTGTRLGDPIEVGALSEVLMRDRATDRPLMIGSVKTNIGHLESAAGIAGLLKVILMMRHGEIPPHLHLKDINPLLGIEGAPIEIPTSAKPWTRRDGPRRAGVSSFGFGGTNAHVILEERPDEEAPPSPADRPFHVVTLSARSPEALSALAGRFADCAEAQPGVSLGDLAHTANTGRAQFGHRAALVTSSAPALRDSLRQFVAEPSDSDVHHREADPDRPPKIAFLYTGQGAQYAGMAGALYAGQPTFRAAIDRCAEVLAPLMDRTLQSLLDPAGGAPLDQTGYTQPVMFAIEYALTALWREWGVIPSAVMGHSVGEFAAACEAGVFPMEDGLRLIAERARLMQALPAGGLMAVVFATEARVAAAIQPHGDRISIAGLNGPESIGISGDAAAVREVLAQFEGAGVETRTLVTSHAFHSRHMDPILEPLRAAAAGLACTAPSVPIISNLTGAPADATTYADPGYWSRHARSPVRFAEGMRALDAHGCEIFLEIGPAPVLVGMGRHCLPNGDRAWLASLRPGRDDWQTLLDSVAQLWTRGARIDWAGLDRGHPRRCISLPPYPFQRRRYWMRELSGQAPGAAIPMRAMAGGHPLLGARVPVATQESVFQSQITAHRPAILGHHRIQGRVIVPGSAYLEMALAAAAATFGKAWHVAGASLLEPLIPAKSPVSLQTIVSPEGPGKASFRIVSLPDVSGTGGASMPDFVTHAVGRLEAPTLAPTAVTDIQAVRARFVGEPFDEAWRSSALRKSGLEPGPTFCWAKLHWVQGSEAWAELRESGDDDRAGDYQFHPGLLDSAFQLLGAALPGAGTGIDAYVPVAVGGLRLHEPPVAAARLWATLTSHDGKVARGDIRVLDASGRTLAEIEGLQLRRVPRDWLARLVAEPAPEWCHHLVWTKRPAQTSAAPPQPGSWLVFDSKETLGPALAERLAAGGHRCEVIAAGADAESQRAALLAFAAGPDCRGIIYLDASGAHVSGAPDFDAARAHGWGGILDVVHAIEASAAATPPRLFVCTRGAQPAGDAPHQLALAQAPAWGLARVIATEHPELHPTLIDLDPRDPTPADTLCGELLASDREDQVAHRGADRFVARLRRLPRGDSGELKVPAGEAYRLDITSRGQLDHVALRPVFRRQPGPGEVEIRVRATGLNFRDVLNVLDLYPGEPGPLGGECSGEVIAVGDGVAHIKPGDAVLALAPASFASHALTLAQFVAPKPEHMGFEEAATIPICFLTAHLALHELGRLKPGERVLIHAASGGVGLAAIQIARQIGAEIFATAGSERKRDYLRSVGIAHVMDSRSVEFAQQILSATAGQGVDLVVNSLTGEAIQAGLSALRPGGRFIELGKTDLWDQARVDAFRPGVSFHAIALDRMMAEAPDAVGRLIRDVMPGFAERRLEPLPLRTFPIGRIVDALRHMAKTEHIGKIVIAAHADMDLGDRGFALRDDGSYLVTGGLGGLGLKLARWLVDRGARQLVLVGRSSPSEEATRAIAGLEADGARVAVRNCDVSSPTDVAHLVAMFGRDLPPLRGIFHLAGVLDDGILREQTRERFDRVMAAKMRGAWSLHEMTLDQPLDLFVLFSSAASLLGAPGQSNYASANAFLDALAHYRRAGNRCALSVNWGPWAEVGMAARLSESDLRRSAAAGFEQIQPERGLETLERLLIEDRTQAAVLPVDWKKLLGRLPAGGEPAYLHDIAQESREEGAGGAAGPPVLLDKLRSVTPAERLDLALSHMRQQAARVLAMGDSELPDPRRMLNELGFDSLTGVEFCNRVGRSIGQHINPTALFDHPTLERFARHVVCDVLRLDVSTAEEAEARPEKGPDPDAQALAEVQGMSEAEMDALITQHLERMPGAPPPGS
ncbi:MAG: SDR family NAD(P)-dependent oxidoreductase [Verrucomicrobiae bacterium]|nr:SDR family NAD(P)-dependent oxidoreductase [Verrucomicrobiae bacterium]